MGLFSKKQSGPYKEDSTNLIYELLFCDNLDLYKENSTSKENYPWNVLFADPPKTVDLQKIILDYDAESRVKLLAYNKLRSIGTDVEKKDLQGVIVEVGLDDGLDVLASYKDDTARYINHTGKMIIWEAKDQVSSEIT